MTTNSKPKTIWVGEGAVRQQGNKPLRQCRTCGSEIVLLQSKRTGKWFPVNVSKGYADQRFYVTANVHKCGEVMERRAKEAEHLAAQERRLSAHEQWSKAILAAVEEHGKESAEVEALINGGPEAFGYQAP